MQILIPESTFQLVQDYVNAPRQKPLKVKGKAEALQVYSVENVEEDITMSRQSPRY
jgi:class 3 adenylate cyclase